LQRSGKRRLSRRMEQSDRRRTCTETNRCKAPAWRATLGACSAAESEGCRAVWSKAAEGGHALFSRAHSLHPKSIVFKVSKTVCHSWCGLHLIMELVAVVLLVSISVG